MVLELILCMDLYHVNFNRIKPTVWNWLKGYSCSSKESNTKILYSQNWCCPHQCDMLRGRDWPVLQQVHVVLVLPVLPTTITHVLIQHTARISCFLHTTVAKTHYHVCNLHVCAELMIQPNRCKQKLKNMWFVCMLIATIASTLCFHHMIQILLNTHWLHWRIDLSPYTHLKAMPHSIKQSNCEWLCLLE